MAVDEQRRRDDLYNVTLRPHDERVEVGEWTYYVRTVRRDHELLPPWSPLGELLVDAAWLLTRGIRRLFARNPPWIVAVVRLGSVKSWNDVRPTVVHRERLAEGRDPRRRIAELAREVQAGGFAPKA